METTKQLSRSSFKIRLKLTKKEHGFLNCVFYEEGYKNKLYEFHCYDKEKRRYGIREVGNNKNFNDSAWTEEDVKNFINRGTWKLVLNKKE